MRNLVAFGGIVLLAALLFVGGSDSIRATTYSPTYAVVLSDTDAGANSDITATYTLAVPHSLPSARVSFIPPQFTVAADDDIPVGARVGKYILTSTHSQSNAACGSSGLLNFTLWEASTDTTDTVADAPRIPSPSWPGFDDLDLNGLVDAVDKYPNFLNSLYPGLTPRARAFGLNDSDPTYYRTVNILIFDPGTALPGLSPLDPSLGYIIVAIEQDPTAPPSPSSVDTDSCSPMEVARIDYGISRDNLGTTGVDEAGYVNRANPSTDGTYTLMDYSRTIRDADNDGIENTLDTCPLDPDPEWNPRSADPFHEFDGDGIPNSCDPDDTTAPNHDEDADGYLNRQDNCALTPNVSQTDSDGDGIGDDCDPLPGTQDGHIHEVCLSQDVDIGVPGTPPALTCPDLITDEDNDGYTEDIEAWVGTDPHLPCGNGGWPSDLFVDPSSANRINLQDVTSFVSPPPAKFETSPGDPGYDQRWDLSPGAGSFPTVINLQDVTALVTGNRDEPPMLGGARAFDGPDCPYP